MEALLCNKTTQLMGLHAKIWCKCLNLSGDAINIVSQASNVPLFVVKGAFISESSHGKKASSQQSSSVSGLWITLVREPTQDAPRGLHKTPDSGPAAH